MIFKIIIWNEGGLPFGLDIEALKGIHTSRPRNPFIADVCFKAGYIDSWGRGTLKIINSCKEAGLPIPEIIEKDRGIRVTLFKNVTEGGQVSGTVEDSGGQEGGQVAKLTDKQKEVLEYIVEEPAISRSKLAEKMGINPSAVQKHIEALKKKGYIERDSDTTGYWKIIIKEE